MSKDKYVLMSVEKTHPTQGLDLLAWCFRVEINRHDI
jgi:hypothetical protein